MNPWFAVYTHPHAENKAANHLSYQGFEVYFPRYMKSRSHARKVDWFPAPLFSRYLFVRVDTAINHWSSINSTIGVSFLVCQGKTPVEVPKQIVKEFKSREDGFGLVSLIKFNTLKSGDQIRMTSGSFVDHIGILQQFDDKQRVTLLLSLMGREVQMSVAADRIEKVL